MKQSIVVAGATGQLGTRIVKELLHLGAEVRVLVRPESNPETVAGLEQQGAIAMRVNNWQVGEIATACTGASCVVSALAGLRDVIITAQLVLLDAALAADVPRFIPSDFSLDFTKFTAGENRNLDLRREFHQYLDGCAIAATTVFNGAFMDMLTGQMPLILFKKKRVLYWGHADHAMGFTTMDNTAAFTSLAALDPAAPRYLRIAGDCISPRGLKAVMTEVSGQEYRLFRAGGKGLLSFLIKVARTVAPGKKELYPAFQGMQYMRNMIDDRALLKAVDNDRYPGMRWTSAKELLSAHRP